MLCFLFPVLVYPAFLSRLKNSVFAVFPAKTDKVQYLYNYLKIGSISEKSSQRFLA